MGRLLRRRSAKAKVDALEYLQSDFGPVLRIRTGCRRAGIRVAFTKIREPVGTAEDQLLQLPEGLEIAPVRPLAASVWAPESALTYNVLGNLKNTGAGDANRTRDPNLGKVMLYP